MNILLVDNDEVYANLLADILRRVGHNITRAPDGLAALHFLKQKPFDLVIADIRMPRMNGISLYQAVRRDSGLHGIPFVWNSGDDELLSITPIARPGVEFKFAKSRSVPDLLEFIERSVVPWR